MAGVAGGIARQFSIDVRLVRLVGVALAFVGIGVPAYLLVWLLVPADDGPSVVEQKGWSRTTTIVMSAVVVVLGLTLAGSIGDHPSAVLPWVVVAVGIWLIVRPHERSTTPPRPSAPPYGPVAVDLAPDVPAAATAPTPPFTTTTTASTTAPAPTPSSRVPAPPRPPRARPFLTPLAVALSVIVAGTALLVGHGTWTRPAVIGSIALLIVGAALVCSAFVGRARGLIAVGLLVAVPVVIGTTVDGRWGDWRSTWSSSPTSAGQLESRYERGFGTSRLDLSRLPATTLDGRSIRLRQLAGDVAVVLPPDATIDVLAQVDAGQLLLQETGRATVERSGTDNRLDERVVTGSGSTHLRLDLHLWAGRLRIIETSVASIVAGPDTTTTPTTPTAPTIPASPTIAPTPATPTTLGGTR